LVILAGQKLGESASAEKAGRRTLGYVMAGDGAIVIKRVRKGSDGGHHGGAWKVAYADFVTAMMAFFCSCG
jgi:hypothetical protein